MSLSDIYILPQFNSMLNWNRYLWDKNSTLVKNQKSPIHNYCADAVPRHIIHGTDPAVVVTNQRPRSVTNPNCQLFLLDDGSFYGGYYRPDCVQYLDTKIERQFNCLMNRLDVHRQSFFYELFANGLVNQGNVSMLCAIRENAHADRQAAWLSMHKKFNSSFDPLLESVLTLIPYRNFDNSKNEFEIMNSTAYTVIMETVVDRSDTITVTEKTIRALQSPRPFLLMASKGSVSYLRNLGFNVYDEFIDHSYDNIDGDVDAMPRLLSIIDQLKYLCQKPATPGILERWQNIHAENLNLLEQMHRNFDKNFDTIDSAFEAAMSI